MKPHRLAVLPALALVASIIAAGAPVAAARDFKEHPSAVVGHAYVDDNTATSNTVAGFDRHSDGSLTPIAGSPFLAGGAGLGAGLPSQGAIQLSSDGRYLLAVDAGTSQISVLRLGFHGVPQLVGSPVSSGGSEPLSIAVSGNLVYVANAGWQRTQRDGLSPEPGRVALPAARLDSLAAGRLGTG